MARFSHISRRTDQQNGCKIETAVAENPVPPRKPDTLHWVGHSSRRSLCHAGLVAHYGHEQVRRYWACALRQVASACRVPRDRTSGSCGRTPGVHTSASGRALLQPDPDLPPLRDTATRLLPCCSSV